MPDVWLDVLHQSSKLWVNDVRLCCVRRLLNLPFGLLVDVLYDRLDSLGVLRLGLGIDVGCREIHKYPIVLYIII